jgi:CDP-glucose 4,6-dehydratase
VGVGPAAVEDLVVDRGFWHGKRVLLTGHTGFKGSWLALWLADAGAEVVGYADGVPTKPSLYELAGVGSVLNSVEGDVRDLERLAQTIARVRPELVIHLAAQAIVRHSFADPVGTYATNVLGTVHVLEAVRHTDSVRAVVNVTSDKCYEERELGRGYREDDAKGGRDPYSSSKGCSELVTEAYRSSFFGDGAHLASARAGNVVGGGDWGDDRLVPDVVRAALAGRPVRIRNPEAVRPWQHVLNPLSGYLVLAQRLWADAAFAEGWNFGPAESDERSVRWIVERLQELWDERVAWESEDAPQPREAPQLRLDSSKARTRLGWKPRWELEHGLERVVEWYTAYEAGEDLHELSLAQIRAFEVE